MATSDDRRPPPTGTPAEGPDSGAHEPDRSGHEVDRDTLRREVRLARLALDPDREQSLSADLARILAAFESLQEVDVSDLAPLHHPLHASLAGPAAATSPASRDVGTQGTDTSRVGISRRDSRIAPPDPASTIDRSRLLEGAPEPIDGHFGVPRTIEQ